MFRRINMNRFLLPLAIMVAMVAIVLPTCQMVGCDMGTMGAMPFMPNGGAYSDCPGQWVIGSSSAPGIVPGGMDSLAFAFLVALLAVVAVLLAPKASFRTVAVYTGDPPPPLEDSFGARFRV